MTTNVQSGLTSVTGSVNVALSGGLATPGAGQVLKAVGVNTAGVAINTDKTIYTVTATKTFYLTAIYIAVSSASATELHINDGSGDTTQKFFCVNATTNSPPNHLYFTFPTPISFTTSVCIRNGGTAISGGYVSVVGFEQ